MTDLLCFDPWAEIAFALGPDGVYKVTPDRYLFAEPATPDDARNAIISGFFGAPGGSYPFPASPALLRAFFADQRGRLVDYKPWPYRKP